MIKEIYNGQTCIRYEVHKSCRSDIRIRDRIRKRLEVYLIDALCDLCILYLYHPTSPGLTCFDTCGIFKSCWGFDTLSNTQYYHNSICPSHPEQCLSCGISIFDEAGPKCYHRHCKCDHCIANAIYPIYNKNWNTMRKYNRSHLPDWINIVKIMIYELTGLLFAILSILIFDNLLLVVLMQLFGVLGSVYIGEFVLV